MSTSPGSDQPTEQSRANAVDQQRPHAPMLDQLLADLQLEFPKFRIIRKQQSRFSRLVDVLLRILTANQMRTFMTHYHTVIGDTLYVPLSWERMSAVDKIILLRHERVHLKQRRRLTFAGMAFVYLVPFLPWGLAYGRARLEWEAYTETLKATFELLGPDAASSPALRRHIIDRFCNAEYGWMWPFRSQLNRWYDRALRDLGC
jgi:hypothetical protein